jgi:class 3 adenylate cyclase
MDPGIQYAQTSDGVSIAYSVMGQGPPLVLTPNLSSSHLQLGMDMPGFRPFLADLTKRLQVIRYDCRGIGMSQRDAVDYSAGAAQRDLQAVVDKVGLDRFALYGHILAGEVPFAYPAAFPDRVSCLVYWIGQSVAISPETVRRMELMDHLMDDEWELFADIRAVTMFGLDSPMSKPYALLLRAAHSPESYRTAVAIIRDTVAAGPQATVNVPALFAHLAGVEGPTARARTFASRMPASHVIAVPGLPTTLMPYVYDNEVLTSAIADFVEQAWEGDAGAVTAPELNLNAMRAILWTDLEAHTQIIDRLGDARGRDVLRDHERLTREALATHGGTEVKSMGDGFIAWFASAQQALLCAIALQRSIALHNTGATDKLSVRVGVNAGEPIEEPDPDGRPDLFGTAVITAARIAAQAGGGEIIASDVVRQLAAGKDFLFSERGAVTLKGFDEPVRLFEVAWRESE